MRVSVSLSKRLDKVARAVQADRIRIIIPGGVIRYEDQPRLFATLAESPESRKGSYLLVPPILSIDDWEALAVDSQMQLCIDTSNYLGPPPVTSTVDPAVVTDRYRVQR